MVSSTAGEVPWPNTAPYNFAKAAQNAMIKNLAFKYSGEGIRINGVLPACIHTGALDRAAVKKGQDPAAYAETRAHAHPMQRVRIDASA
jgi:NAD(P)-dependent dehydrogenase (short-subunit alcohol dehydrogenase family)